MSSYPQHFAPLIFIPSDYIESPHENQARLYDREAALMFFLPKCKWETVFSGTGRYDKGEIHKEVKKCSTT